MGSDYPVSPGNQFNVYPGEAGTSVRASNVQDPGSGGRSLYPTTVALNGAGGDGGAGAGGLEPGASGGAAYVCTRLPR